MHAQSRSVSVALNTNMMSEVNNDILKNSRRRIQDRFENDCNCSTMASSEKPTAMKGWNSFSLSNVSVPRIHATRVLRSGANTLSRTFSSVQTTFGTLSQKFRRSTRRRYRFKNESPNSPVTPQTRSRHILGRTPTKLYSPFGIETPCKKPRGKENAGEPGKRTPKQRGPHKKYNESRDPEPRPECLYNPQRKFDSDVEEVRVGVWEFSQAARGIVTRSLRH